MVIVLGTNTVSSVSGTKNETLTMSTAMTANEYKNYSFIVDDEIYVIASNTTTVITLETTSEAYADLSGKAISILQYYSKISNIKLILMSNKDVPESLVTNKNLHEFLEEAHAEINVELNINEDVVDSSNPYQDIRRALGKIVKDLAAMQVLRLRQYQSNNLLNNISTFWQTVPTFTYEHQRKLKLIKKRLKRLSVGVGRVFSSSNGNKITNYNIESKYGSG